MKLVLYKWLFLLIQREVSLMHFDFCDHSQLVYIHHPFDCLIELNSICKCIYLKVSVKRT